MRTNTTTRIPTATKQSLAPQTQARKSDIVEYKDFAGSSVKLSTDIIKRYICPGSNVTDQEAMMFLMLCKHQGLNPFVRDAYLVKYGGNATIIVGRDAFTKKAQKNPKYKGMNSGVVVLNLEGKIEDRKGEIVLDGETLLGGWAEVFIDGYMEPQYVTVNFNEYVQIKDGKPTAMWASKPEGSGRSRSARGVPAGFERMLQPRRDGECLRCGHSQEPHQSASGGTGR